MFVLFRCYPFQVLIQKRQYLTVSGYFIFLFNKSVGNLRKVNIFAGAVVLNHEGILTILIDCDNPVFLFRQMFSFGDVQIGKSKN